MDSTKNMIKSGIMIGTMFGITLTSCASMQKVKPKSKVPLDREYIGRFPCMPIEDIPEEVANGMALDCGNYGLVPVMDEYRSHAFRCDHSGSGGFVAVYKCVEPTNDERESNLED